ncbi:hypothetical protein MMC06_003864, partial [Schaereria dolodes]|nr:hypothetical protein [Schaereria dolodes]
MAPGIHRGCLLLAICNLFVQISEAQLTGSLTHLTKEPELIKAVITNSGNITVSVLHHNNVFDNTSLSMPFRVVDQEGHKIPIAWTHIVHTAGSYLNLRPGEQFHRDFNLTDYIHFEPETQTITKNISISLPARVEGFEQTGKSIEDTPVNNRLSESIPPSFVTIDSKPLNLTWTSYAHHSSTEKRAVWNPPGINIVPGQCTGSDLGAMQNAILDASYLAGAGLNAAASFTLLPWTYFFKSDIGVSTTVAAVYQRLIQSQLGQGQTIAATCQDRYSYCNLRPGIAAYVAQSKLGSSHPL